MLIPDRLATIQPPFRIVELDLVTPGKAISISTSRYRLHRFSRRRLSTVSWANPAIAPTISKLFLSDSTGGSIIKNVPFTYITCPDGHLDWPLNIGDMVFSRVSNDFQSRSLVLVTGLIFPTVLIIRKHSTVQSGLVLYGVRNRIFLSINNFKQTLMSAGSSSLSH